MERNAIEMREVFRSSEGFCATDSRSGNSPAMLRTSSPKGFKKNWMESRSLWVEKHLNRVFVPVTHKDRFFWMDAITGTLYDTAGKCKSSDTMTIDVSCLRNNVVKAQKILLEAKSGECGVSESD